jgi:hypothetical protein
MRGSSSAKTSSFPRLALCPALEETRILPFASRADSHDLGVDVAGASR